jgi:hypothetical protein
MAYTGQLSRIGPVITCLVKGLPMVLKIFGLPLFLEIFATRFAH